MDFVQHLSAARIAEWHRFPNTECEVLVRPLGTNEIDRCRRIAQKNGKTDITKLTTNVYKKAVQGIRGFTLAQLEEMRLKVTPFEKDGQMIERDTVIESNPIDAYWMNFVIGIALNSLGFHNWMVDHTGQYQAIEEAEKEEEEKKT